MRPFKQIFEPLEDFEHSVWAKLNKSINKNLVYSIETFLWTYDRPPDQILFMLKNDAWDTLK